MEIVTYKCSLGEPHPINQFGTEIFFQSPHKGTKKHRKYTWIASADSRFPEVIYIHKDECWFQTRSKFYTIRLIRIISHETIHQVLWDLEGVESMEMYDYVQKKFWKRIQKEIKDKKERRPYAMF